MKNMTELRTQLATLYEELKNKTMEPRIAKEMNNAAGKIIQTTGMQLKYAELRRVKPKIPFLS